ncbi:NADH-quinone oxidoreductase subunit M [Paenibacillus sp. FSL H8-0548]|uniref:complex I subunit 4 family protein n=1 Tax=Paenibacillus sp. FSL H8-0548 TaxID=1920422 RepID=UPI00096FA831|nr:NADH-quinone oxidoreductase subunit M [Paenibacillus sp. FSL H8-0548]OMF37161.1 NADH-quinone oxidoreductase subunit M [Paenibacillus sp. FSL H8-0548]
MSILNDLPILSLILLSPLLGILVILLLPKHRSSWMKTAVIITTLVPLVLSLWLYANFDKQQGGAAFDEQLSWVEVPLNKESQSGVSEFIFQFQYHLGVDGLSLPLLLLTALVTAMAALAAVHIKKRWKSFFVWFLLLEIGMLGVFLARDLFLFFIFFEITLIAMYFLIGIWGNFNRERAANQFLIYNGLGSAIMLIAFVILVNTAGFHIDQVGEQVSLIYSGSYSDIFRNMADPMAWVNLAPEQLGYANPFAMTDTMQWTLFIMLLVAFGIKLPIFPFHTWMLKVHTEASPSIVMLHSGILLKMGAYGLLRFGLLLFPSQAREFATVLAVLGVINLLYGALLAFRQQELRLVLAYASMSHMGIVLLGFAAFNEIGLQGAVFQLVSHGLISALIFLIVGSIYERTGTTELSELGGLARSMPFISGVLMAAGLASLGLPGLSGFVGEFLSLLGLFESMRWLTAAAVLGIVLTAVYMLRAVLKITFGPLPEPFGALKDARLIEAMPMIVLLAFILLLGCYPSILTDTVQLGVEELLQPLFATRAGG